MYLEAVRARELATEGMPCELSSGGALSLNRLYPFSTPLVGEAPPSQKARRIY